MTRAGPPRSKRVPRPLGCYTGFRIFGTISLHFADHADDLAVAVLDRDFREDGEVEAELAGELGERRTKRTRVAVLRLERDCEPVRRRGGDEPLGAALRNPAGERAHQRRGGRALAA